MTASAIKAGEAYVAVSMRDQKLRDDLAANERRVKAWVKGVGIAGAAAVAASAAAGIDAAADMEEVLNKFNVVFGQNRQAMKEWADQFADDVGRSKREVAEFLANTQDLLIPIGIDPEAAEQMSQDVTRLAIDVASFNNKLDSDVLRDFHSALTGGGETVKKYGVVLDVAATKAKLLENSIDPATANNAQKAWARWQIILDSTTAAQGDAIRSGDSYTNQMKRLGAQLEDLAGSLGEVLLPTAAEFLETVNAIVGPVTEWAAKNPELVSTMFELAGGLTAVYGAVKLVNAGMAIYSQQAAVATSLSGWKGWLQLGASVAFAAGAMKILESQIDEVEAAATKAAEAVDEAAQTPAEGIAASEKRIASLLRRIQDLQNINRPDLVPEVEALAAAEQKRLIGLREAKQLQEDQDLLTAELEKQTRSADKTADALAAIDRQLRLIRSGRGNGLIDTDKLSGLRDHITGFAGARQKVRDETERLNGTLTETDVKLRELSEKGATPEQIAQLDAAIAERDAAKLANKQRDADKRHFDDLTSRAEDIRDSLKTPGERLQDFRAELDELVRRQLLSQEDAQEAIAARGEQAVEAIAKRAQIDESNLRRENSQDLRTSEGAKLLSTLLNDDKRIEERQLVVQKQIAKSVDKEETVAVV